MNQPEKPLHFIARLRTWLMVLVVALAGIPFGGLMAQIRDTDSESDSQKFPSRNSVDGGVQPTAIQGPYVAGWKRRLLESKGAGRLLVEELNCMACHGFESPKDSTVSLKGKSAPDLKRSVPNLNPRFLVDYIANPATHLPGSTMPDLLQGPPSQSEAEAIVHFLTRRLGSRFQTTAPDVAAVIRGKVLFHQVGCVACHAPQADESSPKTDPSGFKPLPDMTAKWDHAGLKRFLQAPLDIRHAGRMPDFCLTDREASDLAHFLLRNNRVAAAFNYRVFRGRRRNLSDNKQLELIRGGVANRLELDAIPVRGNDYTVEITGFLQIPESASYEFELRVDDGALVEIDGTEVVRADSRNNVNRTLTAQGKMELAAGVHPIRIVYYQRNRNALLEFKWGKAGTQLRKLGAGDLANANPPLVQPTAWKPDPGLADLGEKLFRQKHCNACHQLLPGENPHPGPELDGLNLQKGCLADSVGKPVGPKTVADYRLDPEQRRDIRGFLQSLKDERAATKAGAENAATGAENTDQKKRIGDRANYRMVQMNCFACHVRDQVGGPADDRIEFFTSNSPDLGDEGRLPPLLTGVGDKLNPQWFQRVLGDARTVHRERPRPYMNTRMPNFGKPNVDGLAEDLIKLDRQAVVIPPSKDDPKVAKAHARKLVDTKMLQCIACHTFNRHPSVGIQAMDLVRLPERLNRDWFHRYMLKPSRFRPGTRMPESFVGGKSFFPEILDGDAVRQIDAIWVYLSDGERAKYPSGLNRQSLELIVGGEAVVYRNKFRNGGFRGIAVGYPERINLVFDAQSMRLAQIWKGRFLNVSAHWRIQGMGRIGPLGTDVVNFPTGPAFATLKSTDQPWPEANQQVRFGGYFLDELQRPTFMYRLGSTEFEDFFLPRENGGQLSLLRTLTIKPQKDLSPTEPVWFRLYEGQDLVPVENGYRCDGKLLIQPSVDSEVGKLVTRETATGMELLIRISPTKNRSQFKVLYQW